MHLISTSEWVQASLLSTRLANRGEFYQEIKQKY